jgi:hypothetical protein
MTGSSQVLMSGLLQTHGFARLNAERSLDVTFLKHILGINAHAYPFIGNPLALS